MIGYFDTSAIIATIIEEPGTQRSRLAWESCERRLSSLIAIPESHAAIAKAYRMGRLSDREYETAIADLTKVLAAMDTVNITKSIADRAGELAHIFALRGYDAVHAASAEIASRTAALAGDESTVAVAGDGDMLEALKQLGINTINITAPITDSSGYSNKNNR